MTDRGSNPVALRRRLRTELKKARERKSLKQKDVALALDWSQSKVIRIESGTVNVSTTDLRALLAFYGIDDAVVVDELVELAKASRKSAWWDVHRPLLSSEAIKLLGLEASTTVIRQFQALLVPGLLQTEAYARATLSQYVDKAKVDPLALIRMERQRILAGEDAAEAFFILDEAAIRRWVGGPEVIREQLEHLKEMNRRPNVTIQVITFDKGVHLGMQGSFTVFEFPAEQQDYAVFLERPGGTEVIENDVNVGPQFVESFMQLEELAMPSSELDAVIDRVLAEVLG
ncbi:helix-turn-helix transcriptional regulator [Saccharothrix sp. BKS2]|uniref:helix-turn-helix domain-containing protein n=1 Tax=Saccharothrix sp. BKS2 TaxID=3064400 RepID=UPI0039EAC608